MSNENLDVTNIEKVLNNIIGLDSVKKAIMEISQAKLRQEKTGAKTDDKQLLNFMFLGNPGTGKSIMGKVLAEIFKDIGFLKTSQFIEVSRKDFISPYVGGTALKVEEVFNKAIGGVLFIDEAYALVQGKNDTCGEETIAMLIQMIENHAGELIVILSGYEKEMLYFMDKNPGLLSRFPKELRIHFNDYSADELCRIGIEMLKNQGFEFAEGAYEVFVFSVKKLKSMSTRYFGNGRTIRNHVDEIIRRHTVRIAPNDVSDAEINRITKEDIEDPSTVNEEFELIKELDKIIGLESVKEGLVGLYARSRFENKNKMRYAGIGNKVKKSLNFVFEGSREEDKLYVARIIAKILKNTGELTKGHLVEILGKDLIGEYIGQTALKTEKIFNSAIGGVLYISDLSSLVQNENQYYSGEALAHLAQLVSERSGEVVIILSDSEKNVREFFEHNNWIEPRFSTKFKFKD